MILQPTYEQTRRVTRSRAYSGEGFGPRSFGCIGLGIGLGLGTMQSGGSAPLDPLSGALNPATLLQGCQAHVGLSYASVMLATGGGPAAGISGTLTAGVLPKPVKVTITANGSETTATYALYLDGGTVIAQSGTCAASVAIVGLPGLSVTFAAGAYTTSHSYQAVASALADLSGSDAQGYTFTGSARPLITPGVADALGRRYVGLLFDGVDDEGVNTTLTCPAVTSMRLIYRLVSFAVVAITGPDTNAVSPILYHRTSGTVVEAYATGAGSAALGGVTAVPVRVRSLWSNQATDRCRFGANVGSALNAGAGRAGTGRRLGFSAHAGFVARANFELFGIWISSADQTPEDTNFDARSRQYYPTLVV